VWFTNYHSRKATELYKNPWASLTLWWPALNRQIHMRGRVEKLPDEESDEYFAMRSRGEYVRIASTMRRHNNWLADEIKHAEASCFIIACFVDVTFCQKVSFPYAPVTRAK
jgi:pyridoxine/pyridoxamine 5'-phosphate oxidase